MSLYNQMMIMSFSAFLLLQKTPSVTYAPTSHFIF